MPWIQVSVISFAIAMAAGSGKEYGDKGNPSNHWCWYDIIADAIGAMAGTAVAMVIGVALRSVFGL